MAVAWVTDLVRRGNKNGIVLELNDGTLLNGGYDNFNINRSTDKGQTWITRHTAGGRALMKFIDSHGYVYFGSNRLGGAGAKGEVIRSTDNGITWSLVLTVDSGATWRMFEDPSGYVYVSEYSAGAGDSTELYAYNIWRSTDQGASFSKWHQHATQSTPGARDEMRHIHCAYIDSTGQRYVSYGDYPGYGGDAGKNYMLNADGSRGTYMGLFGNGAISFVEADNGALILGGDLSPNAMYSYDRTTSTNTTTVVLSTAFGTRHNSPIYDLAKGKFGVIYGRVNVEGQGTSGGLIASPDDGTSWHLLDVQNTWGSGIDLSINRNRSQPRLYVSNAGNAYTSFPDLTRQELVSLVAGAGRRAVDWEKRGL